MIKVSIIIPIYNAGEKILKAIESAEEQNLNEIEVLCIDDGSTDETQLFLDKCKEKYGNIRLFHQNHNGSGSARNMGIMEAYGEYIAFLDADDIYVDKDALNRMYNAAVSKKMSICGSLRKWNYMGKEERFPLFDNEDDIISRGGGIIEFRDYQNDFCFQSFIYERDFLINNGIFFPDFLRYQDPPFLLNAFHIAGRFWVEPVLFYQYNYGHQNKQLNARKTLDLLEGLKSNLKFSIDNNYIILVNKTISRIHNEYYQDILVNLEPDIMKSLLAINDIYYVYKKENLDILDEICSYQKVKLDLIKVKDAYIISEGLRELKHNNNWEKILGNNKKIVIYGLGNFGKRLFESIQETSIEVVGYMDKKVEYFNGSKVSKNLTELVQYDLIIVAIANYNSANQIDGLQGSKVRYLSDLMWNYWNKKEE